jgi:flagellar biosynthesis/type III secretory pathway protein FliH
MEKKIKEMIDKWTKDNAINKEKVTLVSQDLHNALSEVFEHCMEDGYKNGHIDGYDKGVEAGYDEGYQEGFEDGLEADPNDD